MRSRIGRTYVPKILPRATAVRELARANDIIEKVRRQSSSESKTMQKGCEKAARTLNGIIVDLLKEERDD